MNFQTLMLLCAPFVPPATLEAIVKTESSYRPLAIGVNSRRQLERQPVNKAEATVTAHWLLDHGYNIDLGLGQINSANLSRVGLTVEEIFDPCKNIQAAGAIYHENLTRAGSRYTGEAAVKAALSAYNTGDFQNGFRNGYVRKVLANRETLADSQPVAVQPIPLIEPTEKRHRTRVRPTAEQPADQSQQTPPVAKPKAEEEDSSIPNKTSAVLVYSRPLDGPNEDSVLVYSRVSQKSSANPP